MTMQEAIDCLLDPISKLEEQVEGVKMAVDVLKTQLSEEDADSDTISRQMAINNLKYGGGLVEDGILYVPYREVINGLKNLPSVLQQRRPKTGKWILSDNQRAEDVEIGNYQYFCSECSHSDIHGKNVVVPYCWYCGAKMEVIKNDKR